MTMLLRRILMMPVFLMMSEELTHIVSKGLHAMVTTDFLCEAEEKPNKSNSNNLRKQYEHRGWILLFLSPFLPPLHLNSSEHFINQDIPIHHSTTRMIPLNCNEQKKYIKGMLVFPHQISQTYMYLFDLTSR